MPDSTTLSFSLSHLPPEVLHRIFHNLDVPDILRVRRVSRYLSEVSRSRGIWSDAYRNAKFVRPPGPFPSQSARDLETMLVSSFKVDRNLWQGGSRSACMLREIEYTGVYLGVSLVLGRFLLIACNKQVRCYGLDSDTLGGDSNNASTIYRSVGGTLRSFRCVSAVDVEGRPFACVVLSEEVKTTTRVSIYLLNVGDQSEVTLDLLHKFEHSTFHINAVDLDPRVIVVQGQLVRAPDADHHLVALDVHTRTQFLLPSLGHAMRETAEVADVMVVEKIIQHTSISTSTHLLLACSFYTQAGWRSFLRAFALPRPDTCRRLATPLSVSHCGIISDIYISGAALLHDSLLDPATQDVLVTIRVHAFEHFCPVSPVLKHGLLRLGSVHTSSDRDSKAGTITFQLHGLLSYFRTQFLHPSFNGAGRVFHTANIGTDWIIVALEYDLRVSGNDNDNDGDGGHEAKVIEYPSILRFSSPRTLLDYDPYSGRICLRHITTKYPNRNGSVIEIVDLAV